MYTLKDGSSYIIRRAHEKDLENLLEVLLEVAKEDMVAVLPFKEAREKIISSRDRLYSLLKKQDSHFIYLIGLIENKIISFCDIHIGKSSRDSHIAEFGRSVLKPYRRSGAGKLIQLEAIKLVSSLGIERIELNILSNNVSSIESCKSNGFSLESTRMNKVKLENSSYLNLHTFILDLNNAKS